MRLLLDANLSPRVGANLAEAGYDVQHVAEIGLANASDTEILERSRAEGRVLVTADTDFPLFLLRQEAMSPSVVLLRGVLEATAAAQAELLASTLPAIAHDLEAGAIVSITPRRIRVRKLPLR